ncbi:MAG: DNA-directed RNA polymerase subunit D [Candidatus Micrarchaeota archaeon]|nr:DNA-directed RNA polymerase subunit D [Candidatus Micrarchaeota archaeon]
MDLNLTLEKGNRLEFGLKGAPVPFANLIRRYGVGQVPVFAIDKVTFYENSSSMFDEYISHRIGQVPILSESSKMSDEVAFTLEVEGPRTVYSRDLHSTEAKIKASLDGLPLLTLLEGQNLRLEAKARQGVGRQHAKFQAGLIAYEVLSPNEFKFKVESFTQLEPRTFLSHAADVVIARCDELEEKIGEAKKAKEKE